MYGFPAVHFLSLDHHSSWNVHSPSVVLVKHNFKAKIGRFLVRTTPDDLIFNLKEKVKEERPEELSSIRRSDVRVWKTKGAMVINASTKNHA